MQIIRINQETHRISLGMKQLESDPWEGIGAKFPLGKKIRGTVTNITDYGAFVELEPGIEGLIHVSEMSWTKKNVHPGKILSTTEEVDVVVLEGRSGQAPDFAGSQADARESVGSFRAQPSGRQPGRGRGQEQDRVRPLHRALKATWTAWSTSQTSTGFVRAEQVIEEYNRGDMVKAQVLDVDIEKERISLGIKQSRTRHVPADAAAFGRTPQECGRHL